MEKTTEQLLTRMAYLQDISDPDDADSEVYYKEYRELLDEAKKRLEPTVHLMVRAGLFTIYHEIGQTGYDVPEMFDNGNFWLCASLHPCMTPCGGGDDGKFRNN